MKKLQKDIAKWQKETFGANWKNAYGLFHHLHEEVGEVGKAYYDLKHLPEELADCVILLIGIADAYDINLEKAVKDKMKINKKRMWHKPNKNGVIKHKNGN